MRYITIKAEAHGVKPERNKMVEETQDVEQEEVVESEQPETVDADIYASVKEGLKREREEKKKLKEQLVKLQSKEEVEVTPQQEIAEATAKADIAIKLASDPTFTERKALVEDEMIATGRTLEEADAMIKAKLFDQLNQVAPQTNENLNQINTQATPEPEAFQSTGDPVKDAIETKPEMASALKSLYENSERMRKG